MIKNMKIVVYNEKGGSGKTGLAVCIAIGLDLPLRDLDPQATATRWLERREQRHAFATNDSSAWIADCPPGIAPGTIPTLSVADLVIIPVRASFSDLVTLGDAVRFVQANSRAQIVFVGTAIDSRSSDEAMLRESLEPYGLSLLGITTHRASYRRAGMTGKSPAEIDRAAATEISIIIENIRRLSL